MRETADTLLDWVTGAVMALCLVLIAAILSPSFCKTCIDTFEKIECERPAARPAASLSPTPLPVEVE